MVKRRRGEVGIKWTFHCIEGGAPLPVTGAVGVDLIIVNGKSYPCAIDNAALGIVSFTNDKDDLAEGRHRYYIRVTTATLLIWKSQVKEAEITE
jgi:hypothetical protein